MSGRPSTTKRKIATLGTARVGLDSLHNIQVLLHVEILIALGATHRLRKSKF